MENLKELYSANKDFKEYVDKYVKTYRICVDIALEHKLVENYAKYLEERDAGREETPQSMS